MSGAKLKKHSGNDDLVGRCDGGNETEFMPHFVMFFNGNDMPVIDHYDEAVHGRLTVFG
jgi:phage/plasmid-associated DNA primase